MHLFYQGSQMTVVDSLNRLPGWHEMYAIICLLAWYSNEVSVARVINSELTNT